MQSDRGRWVICPLRGSASIAECTHCPWMEDVQLDVADATVQCNPAMSVVLRQAQLADE